VTGPLLGFVLMLLAGAGGLAHGWRHLCRLKSELRKVRDEQFDLAAILEYQTELVARIAGSAMSMRRCAATLVRRVMLCWARPGDR
jgi:hypothetical protein